MAWYRQRIWTCRISGRTDMTHVEATVSESNLAARLRQEFNEHFEPAILRLIHHCMLN